MTTLILSGRINEQGEIELDKPADLPPGSVRIIVETIDIEAEFADEARWQASFERSQDVLSKMGLAALKEYELGNTVELDPDELDRDDP